MPDCPRFVLAIVLALALSAPRLGAQAPDADHWVGTWATAPVGRPQHPPGATSPVLQFHDQTLRQIVQTSIGGGRLRVVLSNAYGTAPLTIGAAFVAPRDKGTDVIVASGRALAFSGQSTFTIPAGAVVFSDPVDVAIAPNADLAIDLFLPGDTDVASPLSMHSAALQTNYVSEAGNFAGRVPFPQSTTVQSWFLLSRVEVTAARPTGAVVTFGASLTDGTRSTPDTNNRWPNHLARRLLQRAEPLAVLDAGIAGSRLLSEGGFQAGMNALARFERDVLTQTAVTHVVVADMALNDIGNARENPSPSADDLIAALKQLAVRAHARGLKIIGATLTPFEGAAYFTATGEAKRQVVNQWIRTGRAFDGVIDFDQATRDPNHPTRFVPAYDSGDHLHPNDTGYQAMAAAIDLALF